MKVRDVTSPRRVQSMNDLSIESHAADNQELPAIQHAHVHWFRCPVEHSGNQCVGIAWHPQRFRDDVLSAGTEHDKGRPASGPGIHDIPDCAVPADDQDRPGVVRNGSGKPLGIARSLRHAADQPQTGT
jgi:hypothetical protein